MSESSLAYNEDRITELVNEQKDLFAKSELIQQMRSSELLLGSLAVSCRVSRALYRGIPAKVEDDPRTDTLTVKVDKPTVDDLIMEFSGDNGLSQEDIVRLYVGTGIANRILLHSVTRASTKKMVAFSEALSESQGFYARTMDCPVFDANTADETAQLIATEGDVQMGRVNLMRLRAGMFIEVQPDSMAMRKKTENSFQSGLHEVFDGKQVYLETVGLFDISEERAKDMHNNTAEIILGLSFPMEKRAVQEITKIIR